MNSGKKLGKLLNGYLFVFLTLLFLVAITQVIDEKISKFVLEDYKTSLVVLYLISLSILTFDFILDMIHKVRKNKVINKHNTDFINQIKNLKAQEKFLLSLFVDKNVLELPIFHQEPSLGLLESKKILVNTYQKEPNGKTIYRIDPLILEALKINPNLLF
ncbi:MAG: super-infection exclusion protein B [Acinetobacter sp.]|nr:super-infection exclusion protein B [Acinetobacter sp.]